MNATDPLANLRDIHLPGEVAWWPLATGWWILIAISIALIAWGIYSWMARRKRLLLIREVEQELQAIDMRYAEHKGARTLVSDYSQLLRRLVMQHRGRDQVANLTGQQWIDCIKQYLPDEVLDNEHLSLLVEGQYQRNLALQDAQRFSEWMSRCALAISRQIVQEKIHA